MSKRSQMIILSFVALLILSVLIISEVRSRTSFKELVIDQIGDSYGSQEIFPIHIVRKAPIRSMAEPVKL